MYPGLMYTAGVLYHLLHLLHFTVDIRNVCVMLAPFMASQTCIATYLLTKEVWNGSAGVFAAAFIAIAPGQSINQNKQRKTRSNPIISAIYSLFCCFSCAARLHLSFRCRFVRQ